MKSLMLKNMAKKTHQDDTVPCCCSQRWILAYLAFFGFLCLYSVRFNLSVAIVCMVKTETNNISISNHTNSVNSSTGICADIDDSATLNEHAEFNWDKDTRANLLSAFFYGYIITQIPGGYFADMFGGRCVIGVALLICGIGTVLTPVLARTSVILVFIIRVVIGLASGVCFPAMHSMWGRWAPNLERSQLLSLYSLGPTCGSVITFISSGYLCEYGFDNGWGSIFYITGSVTILWVLLWFVLIRDTPFSHPWISDVEQKFIRKNIEFNIEQKNTDVPWLAISKSVPMYAVLVAQICTGWMFYTILTSIPSFMKSVLKFDIKKNGVFSALPNLCYIVIAFLSGQIADRLLRRGILNKTSARKLFQCTAFMGATLFIILAGFTTCMERDFAVTYICLAMAFAGMSRAGYLISHIDYGARYAGILMGITNTFGNITGILTPVVTAKLTPNDTSEEWRNVFFVCAAFNIFGAVVFALCSSGETQEWAKDKHDKENEIRVTKM